MDGSQYRIGVGAGFAGDRWEPAELLAQRGALDALAFECLAERTIGLAQRRLAAGGDGFDARMVERVVRVAGHMLARGGVIVSNGGAADPVSAARRTQDRLEAIGLRPRVAAVTGDDVLGRIDRSEARIDGTDQTLADLGDRVVSANAYLGIGGIVDALDLGADVVITGRVSDAALFLGPLVHHFGWRPDAWDLLAGGTLVGHLLECAGQLTGGYFADGVRKDVAGLAHLGFPFADVSADATAVYGKIAGSGGRLDRATVIEQLLYEIDDPHAYLTPDVTVDLAAVRIDDLGDDRVRVEGARGSGRPERLKVSVGVRDGYAAIAAMNYGGFAAIERAHLAAEIVRERWSEVHGIADPLNVEFVGCNALAPWAEPTATPSEVQVRFSVRTLDRRSAQTLVEEVDALYTNGPAGGGGATSSIAETVGIVSTFIERDQALPQAEIVR